jgi:hypothetical protein
MSHTTTLKAVVIRDVTALRQAVDELRDSGTDCVLLENAKPRMYFGNQHGECDYVLRLNNSQYDVGFDRQADGTYVPVFDEWQSIVAKQLGADVNVCPVPTSKEGKAQHQIGRFFQSYSKHAAINAAVSQGYMIESSSVDDDGNVHLTLAGM